jgi:hypothetical protein
MIARKVVCVAGVAATAPSRGPTAFGGDESKRESAKATAGSVVARSA